MAAVKFESPREINKMVGVLVELRREFRWREDREFKFQAMRKDLIVSTIKAVLVCDFEIYAIVANSDKFEKGYYKEVLRALIHSLPLGDYDRINVDGDLDKNEQKKIKPYLRKGLAAKAVGITFEDSRKSERIQLADLMAGVIARYVNATKSDSEVYYKLIKSRVIKITYL